MSNLVITIGREYGSGGLEIGKKLAEKLGIKCYDNELLKKAAVESGFSEKVIKENDEKPTNSFLYSLVMDTYAASGYSGSTFVDLPLNHKIFMAQFETIKKLASEESCVIVGRCADYALAEHDKLLSIFINADIDFRKERIKAEKGDEFPTEEKLIDHIKKTDKKRASYYNSFSNKKWGEAKTYDLCVKSSELGIDKSVDLILSYINARFSE